MKREEFTKLISMKLGNSPSLSKHSKLPCQYTFESREVGEGTSSGKQMTMENFNGKYEYSIQDTFINTEVLLSHMD